MKRMRRPPPTPWSKFRPFLLPAIALIVLVMMSFGGGFDEEALREHFARGNVEAALASLDAASGADLAPSLRDVVFWSAERRAIALRELTTRAPEELYEDPELVTVVAPLGRHRTAPREVAFRGPTDEPYVVEISHVGLRLEADRGEVEVGAERWPIGATLLPGGTYSIFVRRTAEQQYLAAAAFEVMAPEDVAAVDTALATARELARDERPATLLAAQVALHHDMYGLAASLFEELEQFPAYTRIARELRAITLDRAGLDLTARRVAGVLGS